MKFLTLLLAFILFATTATSGTFHPPVIVLRTPGPHPLPRCIPRRVFRLAGCLCFLANTNNVAPPHLKKVCAELFSNNKGGRCDNISSPAVVVAKAEIVLARCFVEGEEIVLPPGSDQPGGRGGVPLEFILKNVPKLKSVIEAGVAALANVPAPPSVPARFVVTGEGQKAVRLVAYNRLNNMRE